MRFLHTGDWHLGRQMRGISRQSEFEAVLQELVSVARGERVDAVIVAGDTCDTFSPPPDAEKLLYETLRALVSDGIKVVMIAGNHDHALRMDALAGVLRLAGINCVGSLPSRASEAVVHIPSRDGSEEATIAALPWVPERWAVEFESLFQGTEKPLTQYAERVAEAIGRVCASFDPRTVNIFMGHLLVDGVTIAESGGERKLHIGQAFAIKAQSLPAAAQYVALGHVHRPQQIAGAAPTYYAGSLLQLDFGEAGQRKSVNLVEARPGLPARVEVVPITGGRELKNVTVKMEDLATGPERYRDAYLKVTVELDRPVFALYDQVRELLPNTVDVAVRLPEAAKATEATLDRRGVSPDELFSRFYRQRTGAEISPEMLEAFQRLYHAELERAPA